MRVTRNEEKKRYDIIGLGDTSFISDVLLDSGDKSQAIRLLLERGKYENSI